MVLPVALNVVCEKPSRKFAHLGRPAHEVDRKHRAVTATLEKRKEKAKILYQKEKQLRQLRKQAEKNVEKKINKFTEVSGSMDSWSELNKDCSCLMLGLACPSSIATLGYGGPRTALQVPQAAWNLESLGRERPSLGLCSCFRRSFVRFLRIV